MLSNENKPEKGQNDFLEMQDLMYFHDEFLIFVKAVAGNYRSYLKEESLNIRQLDAIGSYS